MSTQTTPRLTEEEYLRIERLGEAKSEYVAGEVFALAGTSPRHNTINGNVLASLHAQLRGGPCRAFFTDLRTKASRARFYTYPDIVVVCGEPKFEDVELDTLLNPTLILEVLSPSTEGYDRGKKFEMYRTIETLREYVLVAQDRIFVERHVRQQDGRWLLSETRDLNASLPLEAIGCTLRLKDIYERVELGAASGGGASASPPTSSATR